LGSGALVVGARCVDALTIGALIAGALTAGALTAGALADVVVAASTGGTTIGAIVAGAITDAVVVVVGATRRDAMRAELRVVTLRDGTIAARVPIASRAMTAPAMSTGPTRDGAASPCVD
jgi:hypothetical protein